MARYIDADALICKIRGIVPSSQDVDFIIRLIEEQPTAYSVESVVEQLGKRKKKLFDRCVHGVFDTIMAEVENIVRNGGKE